MIFTTLQELLARFEAGLIAGEDVMPLIREMVIVAGRSTDPGRWREALAEELRGYLGDLWPEDDEEPPPMMGPCLEAVCEFVLTAPYPELAWVLLVRMDPEVSGPEPVIADMTALLAMGDAVDVDTRADALMARADAERERGNDQSSIEDWVETYGLSDDPKLRIACATELVVVLTDREELLDAAEWAWRAGLLIEETEPEEGPEFWNDVIATQATAADHLHLIDGSIEQIRALIDRMLSRPHWWPEGVSGTELSVLAASAANQDNDIAAALDHLGKARLYWDEADESVQAEWYLTRGETAVLAADLIAAERAVRSISQWISQAGDEEQRRRFEVLVRWATGVAGVPEHGTADDDPVRVLNDIVLRVRAGVVKADDLDLIDRGVASCDPAGQAHLILTLYAVKAMLLAALSRAPEARQALDEAREMQRWLLENKPGGFPQHLDSVLEMAEALIEYASGRPIEAARMMDATWRRCRAAGVLPAAIAAASAAAVILLRHLRRPQQAVEAAVAALTAAQELRHARADSGDRLADTSMHADAHELAIEAAEELGDPHLMAELLEVVRAQAMPHVSPDRTSAGGPLGSLIGSLLAAVQPRPGAATKELEKAAPLPPGVELSPPPLIVMPWGSVALAPWLSYPLDIDRCSGRLSLEPVC